MEAVDAFLIYVTAKDAEEARRTDAALKREPYRRSRSNFRQKETKRTKMHEGGLYASD